MQHERNLSPSHPDATALILSKPDRANPTLPQRKQGGRGLTAQERSAKQQREKRAQRYTWAARVSAAAGYPLTHHLTLTWAALRHGERRDGHCLHLSEPEVVRRLWRNLKHLHRKHGMPFVGMRAPEYDARRGQHLHLALHLPEQLVPDFVQVIERLTGAPTDTTVIFTVGERHRGYVARSACHGWLMQENRRVGAGGEVGLAEYAAKSAQKPEGGARYKLSTDLLSLMAGNTPYSAKSQPQKPVSVSRPSTPSKPRIAF